MLKKITVILLCVLMMFSLASCGVKQNLNEKIAEKVTEGVINKATDGQLDVDLKGDELTLKGKDGEKVTIGDTKWPKTGAGNLLPEFKKGKITSTMNSENGCMIIIEEVAEKDYKAYLEEIKEQGFTNEIVEFSSGTAESYSANKDEKEIINILYDSENQGLHITFEIN